MNCLAFFSSSNAIQQWGRLFLRKTLLLYWHLEERKTMLVNPNYSWSTGVSNLSLSHQHNKCSRGCVKLEGLPGDRLWVLTELWLVKVIQFDSSLLMIREMLGLFPRLPIKSVLSLHIELDYKEAAGYNMCSLNPKWPFISFAFSTNPAFPFPLSSSSDQ